MKCVDVFDVLGRNSLNGLILAIVLPNASHRDAQAVVELAVLDGDIGAVGLHRQTVVSVVNGPVVKRNVRRPDGIRSVGVGCVAI
jgi:hypothetical protein